MSSETKDAPSEVKEAPPEVKEYHGNCHCGDFKYVAKLAPIKKGYECNCSVCTKLGYVWVFPSENGFTWEKGDEANLTGYEFGPKARKHLFCPRCSVPMIGRDNKSGSVGLNARTIRREELDVDEIEMESYNGLAIEPQYESPKSYPVLEAGEGQKLYHGNCHCGAITYTVRSQPLEESEVLYCNCSICIRHGYMWIYPKRVDAMFQGKELASVYSWTGGDGHYACRTCGVACAHSLNEDEYGVNVRTMNDVDIKKLKVEYFNGWDELQPQYVNP